MSPWLAANQFQLEDRRCKGCRRHYQWNRKFCDESGTGGTDTLLAQIVKMVSEAQRTRAPIQRLADRVAKYFVPAVLAASVITFAVWAIFGPQPHYAHALVNAVAVLIIACPCALGLATPMSIMVGTGRGAGEGILIRNAEALETFEKVDTLVVDKTGTLTEGSRALLWSFRRKDSTKIASSVGGQP